MIIYNVLGMCDPSETMPPTGRHSKILQPPYGHLVTG